MWRQKLYAFILRRVLGPFLTTESNDKLSQCIEVSFQEGTFLLKDADLDPCYLTKLLHSSLTPPSPTGGVAVRKASVKRVTINLSLEKFERPGNDTGKSPVGSGVTVRNVLKIGYADKGVALVAHIEVEGVTVEFGPSSSFASDIPPPSSSATTSRDRNESKLKAEADSQKPGNFFSSIFDAAMASLRLSLTIQDVKIRVFGNESCGDWICVSLSRVSYRDLVPTPSSFPTEASDDPCHDDTRTAAGIGDKEMGSILDGEQETSKRSVEILRKAIEFSGFSVDAGHDSCLGTILEMEGNGNVLLRVMSIDQTISHDGKQQQGDLQHDVEISFNERIAASVCPEIIHCIFSVLHGITSSIGEPIHDDNQIESERKQDDSPLSRDFNNDISTYETETDDEVKLNTVEGIMRQYADARHLARTREVRGGILLPSSFMEEDIAPSSPNNNDITSFDAFFDCNSISLSNYVSMIQSQPMIVPKKGGASPVIHTKLKFHLFEGSVKLSFQNRSSMAMDDDKGEEYLLTTFVDLNVTASVSDIQSSVSLEISHFEVMNSFLPRIGQMVEIDCALRFIEDTTESDSCIVSAPCCISISIDKHNKAPFETRTNRVYPTDTTIDVRFQPFELTSHVATMSNLQQMIASFSNVKENMEAKLSNGVGQPGVSSVTNFSTSHVTFTCSAAKLFLSFDGDQSQLQSLNGLFTRCGRNLDPEFSVGQPALGISLHTLSFDLFTGDTTTNRQTHKNPTCGLTCVSATLFVIAPNNDLGSGGPPIIFEMMGCSGEPNISSNSLVSIQYGPPLSPVAAFPLVPPLSSVKVRQQTASEEKGIRGEDPQVAMAEEAKTCETILEVQVPNFILDLTLGERCALLELVAALRGELSQDDDDAGLNNHSKGGIRLGVSLSLEQAIVTLREDNPASPSVASEELGFAYAIIADGLKTFSTLDTAVGFRNFRIFARNLTLYEGKSSAITDDMDNHKKRRDGMTFFPVKTPKELKARAFLGMTESHPVFYRSNLGQPLSSVTPSVQLDVIKGGRGNDSTRDLALHISIYDMTYRYTFGSLWLHRFFAILKGERFCGDNGGGCKDRDDGLFEAEESDGGYVSGSDDGDDACETSLTKLFVTFSDCNIDYTSPTLGFRRSSRSIIRFGEIHLSSNLVSGALVQAYKASILDMVVHLTNRRFPYNAENAKLSCSRSILNQAQINTTKMTTANINRLTNASLEEALDVMHFVSVLNLDSVDFFIKVNTVDETKVSHLRPPDISAQLTMGALSLFVCKDSFSCLSGTFGEWWLNFTAPPVEETAALKASAAPSIRVERGDDNCEEKKGTTKLESAERGGIEEAECTAESDPIISTLLDIIEENIFEGQEDGVVRLSRHGSHESSITTSGTEKKSSSLFANLPDSELSASELRTKHGITQMNDIASTLAKSLLIKNFYTVDTTPSKTSNSDDNFGYIKREEKGSPTGRKNASNSILGEDWTTVDHNWSRDSNVSIQEEQRASWFVDEKRSDSIETPFISNDSTKQQRPSIQIFPQHVPMSQASDRVSDAGDMNAAKFAGMEKSPHVQSRVMIKDLSVNCRFFDGRDWEIPAATSPGKKKREPGTRREEILQELLFEEEEEEDSFFMESAHCPPPLDSTHNARQRKRCRNPNKFFQFSFHGMTLRLDSFPETTEHRLASCLKLIVMNFFLAEAISCEKPRKMIGEWLNDFKHPRDTNDGMITMKMVSMRPSCKVSVDGKLMSDESSVLLGLLPLRCHIDQTALRFIRDFFFGDDEEGADEDSMEEEDDSSTNSPEVMATFFQKFKVKPCKLKVNYYPVNVDVKALQEGSYIEVLNLFPLLDMELSLQTVQIENVIGWGSIFSEMASRWIEDICQTQMYKFLADAVPFHTISAVGGGVIDLVLIPVHHYKHDRRFSGSRGSKSNIGQALRKGTTNFAGTVAFEALNITSKVTEHLAKRLNDAFPNSTHIPSRPNKTPHNVSDTAHHAYESISRGVRTANYTILVIPRREYQNSGPRGAVRSVVRAIPVAVTAPLSGASEAISYSLLGMRNQLRPDIRKEEEIDNRVID